MDSARHGFKKASSVVPAAWSSATDKGGNDPPASLAGAPERERPDTVGKWLANRNRAGKRRMVQRLEAPLTAPAPRGTRRPRRPGPAGPRRPQRPGPAGMDPMRRAHPYPVRATHASPLHAPAGPPHAVGTHLLADPRRPWRAGGNARRQAPRQPLPPWTQRPETKSLPANSGNCPTVAARHLELHWPERRTRPTCGFNRAHREAPVPPGSPPPSSAHAPAAREALRRSSDPGPTTRPAPGHTCSS
jgi:hypothetical protein